MKPAMTSVAFCRTRGASTVKLHPRPVQARRSKHGMSECSLVAGNEPAKSQLMPGTCSQAAAADGSDIAKRRRSCGNVCFKGLNVGKYLAPEELRICP